MSMKDKLRERFIEQIKKLKGKEKLTRWVCPNPLCYQIWEIENPKDKPQCPECGTNLVKMVFKARDPH